MHRAPLQQGHPGQITSPHWVADTKARQMDDSESIPYQAVGVSDCTQLTAMHSAGPIMRSMEHVTPGALSTALGSWRVFSIRGMVPSMAVT